MNLSSAAMYVLAVTFGCHAVVEAQTPPKTDQTLELKLEFLKRILPDDVDRVGALYQLPRLFQRGATLAALRPDGMSLNPEAPSGAPEAPYLPVEFAVVFVPLGEAIPPDVEGPGTRVRTLVQTFCAGARLAFFERIELSAVPDQGLKVSGRVRFYYSPASLPAAPPDRLLAKVSLIERLREQTQWPIRRLLELKELSQPLVLVGLTLSPEGVVAHGLRPWPFGAEALASPPLEAVGLEWKRQGSCQSFELRARFPKPYALRDTEPVPAEDAQLLFGQPTEAYCAAADGSLRPLPPLRVSGKGPLTLRARSLDLSEVVLLIHREAGEPVVVDENVSGQLSVEVVGATLDQAMQALEAYRVFSGQSGRFRVVTTHPPKTTIPPPHSSQKHEFPVTFFLDRTPLSGALNLLQDITGDAVLAPPKGPSVSVYADDVPWDEIYATLLDNAGLEMRRMSGTIRIEPRSGADEPLRRLPLWPALKDPKQLITAGEFELVAISSSSDRRTAWVRSARGGLMNYHSGDRLWDAVVKDVAADRVLLTVEVSDPFATAKTYQREVVLATLRQ